MQTALKQDEKRDEMEGKKQDPAWNVGEIHGQVKLIGISRKGEFRSDKHVNKRWMCQCLRCGKTFDASTPILKRYCAGGCPDCRKQDAENKRIEQAKQHIGEKYGDLEILDFAGFDKDKRGRSHTTVLCRCSCGREDVLWLTRVLNGWATHCKYCARERNLGKGMELHEIASVDGTNVLAIRNNTVSTNSTTGINGVSYLKNSNKYRAYITFQRKQYHLGNFDTIDEAANARKEAEKALYGNFLHWYAEKYPDRWKRLEKGRTPTSEKKNAGLGPD